MNGNVGQNSGSDQFECTLFLDNSDELILDFSEGRLTCECEKILCNKCNKNVDTKRSLKLNIDLIHKEKKSSQEKNVCFYIQNETDEVNYNVMHSYSYNIKMNRLLNKDVF